MALNSSVKSAGDEIPATDPNNLRLDILELGGGGSPTSTGSANTQALAIDAQLAAYATGQVIKFIAGFTNTGAMTININSIGTKNVKKPNGADITGADIIAGKIYLLAYNGTDFVILNYIEDTSGDFGDGSDGNVTISTPTTLTRDMYYQNLILNDDIDTAGFKIFVSETLTRATGKKIYNNGGNGGDGGAGNNSCAGSAGSAGAVADSGSLPSSLPGKAGVAGNHFTSLGSRNGKAGNAGDAQQFALNNNNGVAGGAGGNSTSSSGGGAGAGGISTIATDLPNHKNKVFNLTSIVGSAINILRPVASSGSGGTGATTCNQNVGHSSSGSGGSGASGGIVFLSAKTIIVNGSGTVLEAIGGNGGDAGASGGTGAGNSGIGGSGGGAGGNGGIIIAVYRNLVGALVTDISGGDGGTGSTGQTLGTGTSTDGTDGADGADGVDYSIQL